MGSLLAASSLFEIPAIEVVYSMPQCCRKRCVASAACGKSPKCPNVKETISTPGAVSPGGAARWQALNIKVPKTAAQLRVAEFMATLTIPACLQGE
jgi:hypothetical protein